LRYSYRLLEAITQPNGSLHIVCGYEAGQRKQVEGILDYEQAFAKDGIFARVALLEARRFRYTLQTAMEMSTSAFFSPNTLFFPVLPDNNAEKLQFIIDHAAENHLGVIIYVDNPQTALGREQIINVWLREQSPNWELGLRLPNLDLSLLLAYQLARNWKGQINIITVVATEEEQDNAEQYLHQLMDLGRMPVNTQPIVATGSLDSFLENAPEADVSIFGYCRQSMDLAFMNKMMTQTESSCIFVRDSGYESALA
jgi:solute carrier family 12 sodium/potassium/chloride transporter 2